MKQPRPDLENKHSFCYIYQKHAFPDWKKKNSTHRFWFKKDARFDWKGFLSRNESRHILDYDQYGVLHRLTGAAIEYRIDHTMLDYPIPANKWIPLCYFIDGVEVNIDEFSIAKKQYRLLEKARKSARLDIDI